MATTLLRGGKLIDGTGATAIDGHLLIEDDRISALIKEGGELPEADNIIDVNGCVISPGFIDMHSHMDWILPLDDHDELIKCFVEQGITTLVGGNCGFSPAPLNSDSLDMLSMLEVLLEKPLDFNWRSMGEFLDNVDETAPLVNMAELVGHATVRIAESRTRRGKMTTDELSRCLDQTRKALDEGACGLSLGLMYDPGIYSPNEEIEAFCKVAVEADKPVTVHLKALSVLSQTYPLTTLQAHNVLSTREMLDIAKKTGAKLQISHLIFVGRRSFSSAPKIIGMIEQARREGLDVMFDGLPYTSGNTTINVVLPYWFLAKIPEAYHNRWDRAKLKAELELGFRLVGFMYKDFQVMHAGIEGMDDINGMTVDQIAKKWNTSPFDAMLTLSEKSMGGTKMLFHSYSGEPGNEEALDMVLSNDLCMFESDAVVRSVGYPNPAALGTFPCILGKYARERKMFSIENAIKRMTSMSAERFGIKDRGVLASGKVADLVVFDADEISDTPPAGSEPAGKPKGIKHVFINGTQAVKDGSYTGGPRPGRVIRV